MKLSLCLNRAAADLDPLLAPVRLLIVTICAVSLGCSGPTASYISPEEIASATSGYEIYYLSHREKLRCERAASKGDILAAKRLVEYHEMITRDERQYHHWLSVVARLQKARFQRTGENK